MPRIAVGDRFPALHVETVDGPMRLSDRWRDGPLVVTFMRHFGCSFCREHLEHIRSRYGEITAVGADVVAIFQYTAQATHEFCVGRGLPFQCAGDPLRAAYAELDVRRGRARDMFSLGVMRRMLPAMRTEGVGSANGGDMLQLPGTFVVAANGRVTLAHYGANAADNPPVDEIMDAVRAAAAI